MAHEIKDLSFRKPRVAAGLDETAEETRYLRTTEITSVTHVLVSDPGTGTSSGSSSTGIEDNRFKTPVIGAGRDETTEETRFMRTTEIGGVTHLLISNP